MLDHNNKSTNFWRPKSYQESFLTIMVLSSNQLQEENRKVHKYVQIKHATEQPINKKIKTNFKKSWENENGNTTYKNLWDAAKAVLRDKLIAINIYLKQQEKPKINNPTLQLKELEQRRTNEAQLVEKRK